MSDRPYVQLPNKDLWRGNQNLPPETAAPDAELIPESAQNPVNRAMAQILKAAAGARELTCLWCGMQSDEKYMRKHITENHKSVTEPLAAGEAALATLAIAQRASIEAKANAD